jgi:hypothetical protein
VRLAGTKSWRFGHDDLDVLRRALFVRDAAMLPVAASADVPPRLSGEIPAAAAVLAEADRAAAAGQWLQWWRRMLDLAVREVSVRKAEDPGDDVTAEVLTEDQVRQEHIARMARLQARTGWRHDVCDPPEFAGISAWPELRAAATATHSSYKAWSLGVSGEPAADGRLFEWQLVNDAVHEAAASLGVPVSELDAEAHVMPVEGQWSYIAGPGCGVCSDALARDPVAASDLLRRLFMSAFPGASG